MNSLRLIHRALTLLTASIISLATATAESVEVNLHVDESKPGPAFPADFLGFSYEKNVLALDHFKPSNTAMVNLMRHLGGGVLRFGGNYVEITAGNRRPPKSFSKDHSISSREISVALSIRPLQRMDCDPRAQSRSQRPANGRR